MVVKKKLLHMYTSQFFAQVVQATEVLDRVHRLKFAPDVLARLGVQEQVQKQMKKGADGKEFIEPGDDDRVSI